MKTVISIIAILLITAATVGMILYLSPGKTPELSDAEKAVVINEVMSSNTGVYLDDKGKSSDWVELYNPSDEDVSLSRFSLSDDEDDLEQWTFPDVVLKAHGYIVVFLSGSKKDSGVGSLHAPFKLNAKGDVLILSVSGSVVSRVELPPMDENVSYVRAGNQWLLSNSPTPGKANGE